jgi:hypothetical protein
MKDLKLNQKILTSLTSSSEGDIVTAYQTTLVDAVERYGELRIVLGEGHFGCIPDRTRDNIIANKKDIKAYFKKEFDNAIKFNLEKRNIDVLTLVKERKAIFIVEYGSNKYLTIRYLDYMGKVNSLKEGEFNTYGRKGRGEGNFRVKVGETHPNVFRSEQDAYKQFEKLAMGALK